MKAKDFIINLRKKNKLSTKEFADKIGVKEKKIIQYESGKKKISIKVLNKIIKVFDIDISKNFDINEILNKVEKTNKLNKLLLSIICFISLCLIILTIFIIFKYKNNNISIYSFNGESDNFKFTNGLVVFSKDNKYIELSGFKIKNDIDIKSMTINVAFNESIWAIKEYDSNEDESLRKWLKYVDFSEYDKEGFIFDKKDNSDSFSKYVTKFPYDFKVEINYCTNDDCNVEILDINSEKLNTNSKIKNK